jgi:TetR/AcrR family transcriptional regulator
MKPAAKPREARPLPRRRTRTAASAARLVRPARIEKEQGILREAEAQFARYGFEGASLEGIASAVGISRHNLLYYFPSKEQLYRRVLDDVMTQWLAGMGALAVGDDPEAALARYIAAKMRSSRERPDGSKTFTKEVIAGAPHYADVIIDRVGPALAADVRVFERWARQRRIAKVDFTHLMFVIWAVTQAYADLAPQFALLLGKRELEGIDYARAQALITRLVLAGVKRGD